MWVLTACSKLEETLIGSWSVDQKKPLWDESHFPGQGLLSVICGGQGIETDTGLMEMLCCFAGHAEAGGILSVTEKQKLLLTIDT